MAMSPQVQAEYDAALKRAVLSHGSFATKIHEVTSWDLIEHARRCQLSSPAQVREDSWHEFKGTFDEGDGQVHGLSLADVSCACGQIGRREWRWSASPSELAEAVFAEAVEPS